MKKPEQQYRDDYKIFEIGKKLKHFELTIEELEEFGRELISISGICENCNGTGLDSDPPDANGVGGGFFKCPECRKD